MSEMKRQHVLADLVGHPQGSPTIEELDYMNPALAEEEIRDILDEFVAEGRVEILEGEEHRFYALAEGEAAEYAEEAWQRQYASVEKTEEIEALEALPRPER